METICSFDSRPSQQKVHRDAAPPLNIQGFFASDRFGVREGALTLQSEAMLVRENGKKTTVPAIYRLTLGWFDDCSTVSDDDGEEFPSLTVAICRFAQRHSYDGDKVVDWLIHGEQFDHYASALVTRLRLERSITDAAIAAFVASQEAN